ncbi:MAG: hypothetical protein SFV21_00220 [Rhodospirillaceae bacterium]|nr:hypothetical protein [Rhodospirillaceae bacterium]
MSAPLSGESDPRLIRPPAQERRSMPPELLAEQAAEKAVHKALIALGIDTDDADSMARWHGEREFTRAWMAGTSATRGYVWKAFLTVAIPAAIYALAKGVPFGAALQHYLSKGAN